MKLSKDKTELRYNSFLTLRGIPPEASEYRLGNRSALEWIVDQYQVSTDKRSGIVNDPNREDDPQYILRLIGQVIHVSLETVKRTRKLAALALLSHQPAVIGPLTREKVDFTTQSRSKRIPKSPRTALFGAKKGPLLVEGPICLGSLVV
jgi:hypothetical protein